jgi:hypothetical protein
MAKARAYRYASRAGLLICVLLAIAWVTSLFYWVYLVYARPTSATYWGLTGGGIGCWNMEGFFEVDEHGEFSWEVERIHLGIGWRPFTGTYATFLPLWIPFVLVALVPPGPLRALRLRSDRQRQRCLPGVRPAGTGQRAAGERQR